MLGQARSQDVFGRPGELPRPAPVIPLETGVKNHSSISVSKQFVVHGRSLELRSAFSRFAESVKGDFLDLLYSTGRGVHPERIDQWKNQIVVQVRDQVPAPGQRTITTRIRQLVPSGFRIELTVRIGGDIDRDELREELIRLLLAECIVRDHKSIRTGGRTELLPKWLMAGVSEILRQKVQGRPSDLYEKVFKTGSIMSVEEIMMTDPEPLDSLTLKIFELSSAGLIHTLLDQASGANRMRSYLSELAVFNGSQRDLLLKHFPGLRTSGNSLEKWWALQMATMSQPGVFELMTPEETELALTDALIVEFDEMVESGANEQVDAVPPKPSLGSRVLRLIGVEMRGGPRRIPMSPNPMGLPGEPQSRVPSALPKHGELSAGLRTSHFTSDGKTWMQSSPRFRATSFEFLTAHTRSTGVSFTITRKRLVVLIPKLQRPRLKLHLRHLLQGAP